MSLLEEFYHSLVHQHRGDKLTIPHSTIFYIRAAILSKTGVSLELEDVERLLYEEGLLDAKFYGIPKWYRDKYFPLETPLNIVPKQAFRSER